ncbi:MAG: hypothetical protein KKH72_00330 [Alphaproteobacteria bacterium]|nr:hypothetical protein [Alphaproteobacteria bacterium]
MNYEERNTWVSLVTGILVVGYFLGKVLAMNENGEFAGVDGLTVWARTVLWMIPVSIVLTIVLTILVNIAAGIAEKDHDPDFTSDERDKRFSGRGMIAAMVVSSIGLLAALGHLALGGDAFLAFNVILFTFAAASLSSDVLKLFFYRRGY